MRRREPSLRLHGSKFAANLSMKLAVVLAVAAAVFFAAGLVSGSRSVAGSAPDKTLTVLAAASLREAFTRIGAAFEAAHPGVKVRFAFAGTQELRVQLEHGATADVFAAADTKHTSLLEAAGLIGASTLFAQNRLVIIVPRGNSAAIRGLADLPRARRLVVGAAEVPIGTYTMAALAKAAATLGPQFREGVASRVVSRELNVKQIVAKVVLGEADAAIVYETDARAAATKVETIAIPTAWNVTADYPAAVVQRARHPALARKFVEHLTAGPAQETMQSLGFQPPVAAKPTKPAPSASAAPPASAGALPAQPPR
ncbi:MAG TPA: molybdate ABC transporter substrate-binding protein [Polyangia bacterium]